MPNDKSNVPATRAEHAPAPAAKAQVSAGGKISAFVPQTIDEAFRLSQALAIAGDMVPKAFQGKPEAIMGAIMRGAEIGLAPMQALSNIAVVNGRATIWGDAIPALMQRAGHHVDVDYEGGGDTLTAVATLTRGDTGRKIVRRFSMSDAKRAGLLGKQGPWSQYPQRMLAHRARTWACRDGAADALMGMTTREEALDMAPAGPDGARDVTPAASGRQAPRRGGIVLPEPEPEVDEVLDGEIADGGFDPETGEIEDAGDAAPEGDEWLAGFNEGAR